MHVGGLRVELRIPGCRSLKEKRSVVRPIVESARHRFGVSAAEVDHQDHWQQAALGFSTVSGDVGRVTAALDEVERFVWSRPGVEVVATQRGWLEMDE